MKTPKCAHCLFALIHHQTVVVDVAGDDGIERLDRPTVTALIEATEMHAEDGTLYAINQNTHATLIAETMYKGTWLCAGHLPDAVAGRTA